MKKTISHLEWLRIMRKMNNQPPMTRAQLQHEWMTKFPRDVREQIKKNLAHFTQSAFDQGLVNDKPLVTGDAAIEAMKETI